MAQNKHTTIIDAQDKTKGPIEQAANNFKRFDNDIKNVSKSVDFLSKAFVVGLAAGAFAAVSKFTKDTIGAFAEVERSQRKLRYSIENMGGSFKNISNFINDLGKVSSTSTTDLTKLASEISSLGKSEDEIKKLMTASNALAEATGKNINEAFKQLNSTFAGSKDELSKLIPELNNLSKEQLANGSAIDITIKKFEELNNQIANSTSQKLKNLSDNISSIKEGAGEALANAFGPFINVLVTVAEKIANVIGKFNELKRAQEEVALKGELASLDARILAKTQQIKDTETNIAKILYDNQNAMEAPKEIEELRKKISEYRGELRNLTLNRAAIEKYGLNQDGSAKPSTSSNTSSTATTSSPTTNPFMGLVDNALKKIEQLEYKRADNLQKLFLDYQNSIKPFVEIMENAEFGTLPDQLKDVFTNAIANLTTEYENALAEATKATPGNYTETPGGSGGGGLDFSIFGESMNTIGLLMEALGPVIGMFMQLDSIRMLLDPLQIVLDGMLSVLKPVIDSLLRPVIGIFRILGETLGKMLIPIFQVFGPVVMALAKGFTMLYNMAIMPLGNMIIKLITTIYNGVASVVNGMIRAINKIPGVNIKWRMDEMNYNSMKLDKISTSDLDAAGARAGVGYSGSSGGQAASYAGQRDITNNFYISVETINGTDKEAAKHFWDNLVSMAKTGEVSLAIN